MPRKSDTARNLPLPATIVAALILGFFLNAPAHSACNTRIVVLFDISQSTRSRPFVEELLRNLTASTSVVYTVTLIPFGSIVAPACASDLDPRQGFVGDCLNYPSGIEDKTDLRPVLAEIDKQSVLPIPPGERRVFAVFSDFIQSTQITRPESLAEWIQAHRNYLNRIKTNMDKIPGQSLLFFQQRQVTQKQEASIEIARIGAVLREYFKVADASADHTGTAPSFYTLIDAEIRQDPTPLKVRLLSLDTESIRVELENPSCVERDNLSFSLRPQDGKGTTLRLETPRECLSIQDKEGRKECSLRLDGIEDGEQCDGYFLRVAPADVEEAAGETEETVILDDCLMVHSIDIDVLRGVDGAPHLRGCSSYKNKDSERWRSLLSEDLANMNSSSAGRERFVGCMKASGSLVNDKGHFELSEPHSEDESPDSYAQWLVGDFDMKRFMVDSSPMEVRAFPFFFLMSRAEARRICRSAHDETPRNLQLVYSTRDATTQRITIEHRSVTLSRNRNRDVEEELHDLWESSIIPVLVGLSLSLLAIYGSRRISTASVEEHLAVVGLGAAALFAAIHDASNLGDWFENRFSANPILWSSVGLIALVAFFAILLGWGVFDPRVSQEAAWRQAARPGSKLGERRRLFQRRFRIWLCLLVVLDSFALGQIACNEKRIEECHYMWRND